MSFTKFVSSLLGVSSSSVSAAHHKARDDSGVRMGGGDKKHFSSPPSWAKKTTPSGQRLFPNRKK